MADELIDPFVTGQVGDEDVAPPLPSDAEQRAEFMRGNLPGYLQSLTAVDKGSAPAASVQAVLDSGSAETYDFSALDGESLELIVDDYEGRKDRPGTPGVLTGGAGPVIATVNTVNDQATVAINGEAPQAIDIGTKATGALVAAQIQTAVRALTAATAKNQAAYDGFLAEYVAPSFSTTLATELANGVKVYSVLAASVAKLKIGDTIAIADQAGGPAAAFSTPVIDIDRVAKRIYIKGWTPGEAIEVGALIRIRDDHYEFTVGKAGAESAVVFAAGVADMAVGLKLTVAAGALATAGKDADGPQKITFVDADFVDPAAATAAEVAVKINASLTGAVASDNAGTLRITSTKYGESANLKASAGVVQVALDLPTTIEVGTNSDFALSLVDAEIVNIQKYTIGSGVVGINMTSLAGVRVEGKNLVNVDGTDHGAGGTLGWIVTSRPKRVPVPA
jgi:hypothetical protein